MTTITKYLGHSIRAPILFGIVICPAAGTQYDGLKREKKMRIVKDSFYWHRCPDEQSFCSCTPLLERSRHWSLFKVFATIFWGENGFFSTLKIGKNILLFKTTEVRVCSRVVSSVKYYRLHHNIAHIEFYIYTRTQ